MSAGLTQSEMDSFATQMLSLTPQEEVTYTWKATSTAVAVDYTPCGLFSEYTLHQIALDPALRNARRFRMAVTALTVQPTRYDVISRANGEVWKVDRITGGAGRPFWLLELSQVG